MINIHLLRINYISVKKISLKCCAVRDYCDFSILHIFQKMSYNLCVSTDPASVLSTQRNQKASTVYSMLSNGSSISHS